MDREQLEAWLNEGLSLDRIGALVGRHPSTVSYWLKKYDLVPNGRTKHAAKGAVDRERLAFLVAQGLPIRSIAKALGVSASTVRHWLERYELSQPVEVRNADLDAARARGERTVTRECKRHGETTFVIENSGRVRCRRCRVEARGSMRPMWIRPQSGGPSVSPSRSDEEEIRTGDGRSHPVTC